MMQNGLTGSLSGESNGTDKVGALTFGRCVRRWGIDGEKMSAGRVIYRFGQYEADIQAMELRKRGLRVRLQQQPYRVLTLLLENAGAVVSRDRIKTELWPEDTFVDFDHGLNSAVNKIRQALSDTAANPRYLETVPRRGYRFIAPVTKASAEPAPLVKDEPAAPAPPPTRPSAPGAAAPGPPGEPSTVPKTVAAFEAPNEPPSVIGMSASKGDGSSAEVKSLWGGWAAVPLLVAAACFLFFVVFGFTGGDVGRESVPAEAVTAPPPTWGVRILAGQQRSAVDSAGVVWDSDRYFVGGLTASRSNSVLGADDPSLFRGERYGSFEYVIPTPPGQYKATLHFAETWFGETNPGDGGSGSRIFDVRSNGKTLIRDLDIYREAGGANRALKKEIKGLAPDDSGRIVLSFNPAVQYAAVNAIEIEADDSP